MDKKNGQPPKKADHTTRKKFIKNPRQRRVLMALAEGPKSREQVDRIAGAHNGPDVVRRLRQKGWDIPCDLVDVIDRDGRPARPGVYRLSGRDRARLAAAFD